ncbi:MAG: YrzE family protein [Clostridia bacterium]|nr:YrzE family protein [Clostridia bacterium]
MKNVRKALGWGLGAAVGVGGIGSGLFLLVILASAEASLYIVPWVRAVWLISALAGGFGSGFAANRKGWLAGGFLGLFWGSIMSLTVLQVIPDSLGMGIARALLTTGCLLGAVGGIVGINYRDRLYALPGMSVSQGRSRRYKG